MTMTEELFKQQIVIFISILVRNRHIGGYILENLSEFANPD